MALDPTNHDANETNRPGFKLDKLESRILLSATWAEADQDADIDAEVDAGDDGSFPELASDGGEDLFDAVDGVPLPAPEAVDYTFTVEEDSTGVTGDVLSGDGEVVTTLVYETSFENTGPGAGQWGVMDAVDGWQLGDGAGIEVQNDIAGDASDGTSHLELDSHDNSSMHRDLPTSGGQSYTLSFDYSPRPGVAAESNGIEVWWGGEKVGEITEDGTGLSATEWQRVSIELPGDASADDARLELRAVGTEDSLGGYLDALKIEAHTEQQLEVDGYTQPDHGQVTYNGDGTFTFTPDADFVGEDSFEYRVVDQFGQSSTGTIEVSVIDQPELPTLVTQDVTGLEDTAIALNISVEDLSSDTPATFTVDGVPEGAELSVLVPTPDADASPLGGLMETPSDAPVDVTFEGESAGYRNSVGTYRVDPDTGAITGVSFLWSNASLEGSGGDLIGGESTVSVQPGEGSMGVFVLANGDRMNDFEALGEGTLEFRDADGNPATLESEAPTLVHVSTDGTVTELDGRGVYHSAGEGEHVGLNSDGIEHVRYTVDPATGSFTLGIEDLYGGGDNDFDDARITITLGAEHTALSQGDYSVERLEDGSYRVGADALEHLQVTPAEDFSGSFEISVKAEAVNLGASVLTNGDFEDTDGSTLTGFGRIDDVVDGWVLEEGPRIELHNPRAGVEAIDGDYWLDLDASPGNVTIAQQLSGVQDGETYQVDFSTALGSVMHRGEMVGPDSGVDVFWNGELIASIGDQDTDWETHSFEVVGGSGDGTNTLRFAGTGPEDNVGVSLDAVSVRPMQLEETTAELTVNVQAVADAAELSASGASGVEDTAIPLTIAANATDVDGSEFVSSVTVSNVPEGATLSAGADQGDGTWVLSAEDLDGLTITPAEDFAGSFDLVVDVEVREGQAVGFEADALLSHGGSGQDREGPAEVQDDGDTLYMAENSWKAVPGEYTVTENTIIEFQYRSTETPELAMIGFDNDGAWNNGEERNHHFNLFGTQGHADAADNAFRSYAGDGEFQTFRIPVGEYFTGDFDRMFFINDDDAGTQGNSFFSNVRMYEAGEVSTATQTLTVDVEAVADGVSLDVADASGVEDTAIALDVSAALMDVDGSEVMGSVTIGNVPEGATLSAGADQGDGTWLLSAEDLEGLTITPTEDFSGSFELTVEATSYEAGDPIVLDASNFGASDTGFTVQAERVDAEGNVVGAADVAVSGGTLGVSGDVGSGPAAQLGYNAATGEGERFVMTLDRPATGGSFDFSRAFLNEGTNRGAEGHEQGAWKVFDGGTLLAEGTFTATEGSHQGTVSIALPDGVTFDRLELSATEYSGGQNGYTADSSDFLVDSIRLDTLGDASTSTASLTVDVEAVVDGVDLATSDVAGSEDGAIALTIDLAERDVDGSEVVAEVRISGVPEGAELSAGTDLGDGVWRLSAEDVDGLTVTPAADSDADFDLTVEVVTAEPVLALGGGEDALDVVAGEVSVDDGVWSLDSTDGDRHHAVATFEAGDLPESFVIDATFEADRVPGQWQNGFVVFDYEGPDDFKFAGARVGADYWTIGEVDNGRWIHSERLPERIDTGVSYDMRVSVDGDTVSLSVDGEEKLSVTYDERPDFSTLGFANDNASTSMESLRVLDLDNAVTQTETISVDVSAVADAVSVSVSDASGAEDTAIRLSIDAGLTDTDGSERFAVVVSNVPDGATLSAGELVGEGEWMVQPEELEGLSLTPPEDFSGTIELSVNTVSVDSDGVINGEMLIAGDQVTLDLDFASGEGEVDAVSGDWTTGESGLTVESDPETGLGLALIERPVNSDVFTVETTFVSERAPGQWQNSFVVFDADGDGNFKFVGARVGADFWTIGEFNDGAWRNLATLPETIDPDVAYGMSVSFDGGAVSLSVDGEAKVAYDFGDGVDTSTLGLANHNATTSTQDFTVTDASSRVEGTSLTVDVESVADAATLETPAALVATQGLSFPLDLSAALNDVDGSESLSVRLDGFPEGTTFNVGQPTEDGGWVVSGASVETLTAQTPDAFTGEFELQVTAISTESDGDRTEVLATVGVQVLGLEEDVPAAFVADGGVTPAADFGSADAEAALGAAERSAEAVSEVLDAPEGLEAVSVEPQVRYEPFALPEPTDTVSPSYELDAASFEIEQTVEEGLSSGSAGSETTPGVEDGSDRSDETGGDAAGVGFAAKFWALMRGMSVTRNGRDD